MSIEQQALIEVADLCSANRGLISPQAIVDWARHHKKSVLHHMLQWNDKIASESWRRHQMRQLLRVYVQEVVLPNGESQKIRAFVSLWDDRYSGSGYRSMIDVMNDDELRRKLLIDARGELRLFQRKYRLLKELVGIFEAIDDLDEDLSTAKPSKENRRPAKQARPSAV